jgi:hypothetical protein
VLAFHNGDTLENIPVIHDEAAPRPPQFPWRATMTGGAVAAVVGVCLALVLHQQNLSDNPRADLVDERRTVPLSERIPIVYPGDLQDA